MPAFDLKLRAATNANHWQLALDKFPFNLRRDFPSLSDEPDRQGKEHSIKPVRLAEIRDRYAAAKPELQKAVEQRQRFLASLALQHSPRFRRIPLVNSSRLLLHLGRSSVMENVGLYCDRTTGLPIIPGPAVKGTVSTWACWEGNLTALYTPDEHGKITLERHRAAYNPLARRILGDNSAAGSAGAGQVVFLGAVPQTVPVLGLDIVTPHTNQTTLEEQDPKPNPYLCVEAGTVWDFTFFGRPGDDTVMSLLEQTQTWLTTALDEAGLGAKTASGYGRFVTQEAWRTALQAPTSEEGRVRLAEARAGFTGDYTEELFQNKVVALLTQPGKADLLKVEIKAIQDKEENHPWIVRITDALRGSDKEVKAARKRLKEKELIPPDWFPQ